MKGRSFASLEEQNRFLLDWERRWPTRASTAPRVSRSATISPRSSGRRLQPLPLERFPSFREARRTVHRDGHVEVDRAYYSVPPEYLARGSGCAGTRGWCGSSTSGWSRSRVTSSTSRAGSARKSAAHRRREDQRGRARRRLAPGAGASPRPEQPALGRGGDPGAGIEAVRVLHGLLSLAKRHPSRRIERACEIAASHGAYRLRTLRALIDREAPRQEVAALPERASVDPSAVRLRPVRPRRIPTQEALS